MAPFQRSTSQIFCEAFTAEWNRLAAEPAGSLARQRGELERVRRQLDKLVDALADGAPVSTVKDRIVTLEARRELLERELRDAMEPPPRLHPSLARIYRAKVASLAEALSGEDGAAAREQVRALVDEVRLIPKSPSGKFGFTLRALARAVAT